MTREPVKKTVVFDQRTIDDIERWRASQTSKPDMPEAIRRLVKLGLSATSEKRPFSTKAANKASELAANELDRLADKSATDYERVDRKNKLLNGPKGLR